MFFDTRYIFASEVSYNWLSQMFFLFFLFISCHFSKLVAFFSSHVSSKLVVSTFLCLVDSVVVHKKLGTLMSTPFANSQGSIHCHYQGMSQYSMCFVSNIDFWQKKLLYSFQNNYNESYDLNYIFGSDLTLSLGFIFFAEGDAIVHDTNGSNFKPKTTQPSFEGHLFGPLSSIYLGYKIGFLELIIGINDSYIGYNGFVCSDNNCVSPDSQKGLEWGTYPNETIMAGIGLVF